MPKKDREVKIDNSQSNLTESFLIKLFDRTGNESGGNKGFFLFFINSKGEPALVSNFSDTATRYALQKAIEDLQILDDKEF